MIDLHHHCLPGVDDGPREWDEAVALCRMAQAEGIDTIVATPHVLRGRWKQFSIAELESRIDDLRARVGDSPRLLLGSEYFFGHDVVEVLEAGTAIVPLAGSRYVLMELASNSVPPLFDQPLYRMQLGGWVPVIAHPERNLLLQSRPELVESMAGHGAKMQLTAGSLIGEFGPAAQQAAEELLRRRLVHFVATDAHSISKRPPRMAGVRDAIETIAGAGAAEALLERNPRCVVENRALEYDPDPRPGQTGGFFTRLRSFFER